MIFCLWFWGFRILWGAECAACWDFWYMETLLVYNFTTYEVLFLARSGYNTVQLVYMIRTHELFKFCYMK